MCSRTLLILVAVLASFASECRALNPAPVPAVTQAPQPWDNNEHQEGLRKRDGLTTILIAPDATCGYIGGNSENPAVTCVDALMKCVAVSRDGRADIGCCQDFIKCPDTILTDLLGFNEASRSGFCSSTACDTAIAGSQVGICQQSSYTYAFEYSLYGLGAIGRACDISAATATATLLTTYIGQTGRSPWVSTVLTPSTTPASDRPTSTSSAGGSTPTKPGSSDKSNNVGAIAGGVVGGIAVLALVGSAAFCLLRKQRRQAATEQPSWQPSGQMQEQPTVAPIAPQPHMAPTPTNYWQQQQSSPTSPSVVPFAKSPVLSTTGPGSPVSQVPSDYSSSQGGVYHSQSPVFGTGGWQPPQPPQRPQYSPAAYGAGGASELPTAQGGYEHHRGTMQELPDH